VSKKFIIFVIDDLSGSATSNEIETIDIFNDQLRANGEWIFAGGLAAPSQSTVIDNRNDARIDTGEPLFSAPEQFSGFWLIQAESYEVAKQRAFEGSKACNRKVELRALLG
jgi:hypothetical protein